MSSLDSATAERRQKIEAILNYLRQREVPNALTRKIIECYEVSVRERESVRGGRGEREREREREGVCFDLLAAA